MTEFKRYAVKQSRRQRFQRMIKERINGFGVITVSSILTNAIVDLRDGR